MSSVQSKNYIPAIDGLRALAVLAVIANHYFESWAPSGFLGVDIFFVISGFVITQQLVQSQYAGWKDYLFTFYARRIRRLYPALLFCVLFTATAFLLLTTRPAWEVFKTGGMALFGFSNNYLYKKAADYFSLDAQLNPFTHTWSLGVEEQFYFIFPALLALLGFVRVGPRTTSQRPLLLAVIVLSSLAVYLTLWPLSRNAAFYLLPARFWELGIGSLCFLYVKRAPAPLRSAWLFGAFLFLITLLFLPNDYTWLSTLACVAATALLLIGIKNENSVSRVLGWKVLVFIGLISYSLYLWHWSILIIGKWTFGETLLAKGVCLSLAVGFALFSYYVIERPLRYSYRFNDRLTVGVSFVVVVTCAMVLYKQFPKWTQNHNHFIAGQFGVQPLPQWEPLRCSNTDMVKNLPHPIEDCLGGERSAQQPHTVYLIGDSHAAHMFWAVRNGIAGLNFGFRFLNTAQIDDFPVPQWQRDMETLSAPLDYLVRHARQGDYVVIAFHRGHLNALQDKHLLLSEKVEINQKTQHFLANMRRLMQALEPQGVKVILVRDTPLMSVVATSTTCAFQIKVFGESICRVTQAQDLHTRERQDYVYDHLTREFPRVYAWDPQPLFFGSKGWVDTLTQDGEHYVMLDWNHITQWQSEQLAPAFTEFFKSTF